MCLFLFVVGADVGKYVGQRKMTPAILKTLTRFGTCFLFTCNFYILLEFLKYFKIQVRLAISALEILFRTMLLISSI